MSFDISTWWVNTVTVETLQGQGAYGATYAAPVSVDCLIEDENKLIRDGKGDEVVSATRLYGPIEREDLFSPGSRVTLPTRVARVITCNRIDTGRLNLALDHIEVQLT